ncbi:unnamed protein product [Caenorhabditis brenneri]
MDFLEIIRRRLTESLDLLLLDQCHLLSENTFFSKGDGIPRHWEYNHDTYIYKTSLCKECLEDYFTYKWEEPKMVFVGFRFGRTHQVNKKWMRVHEKTFHTEHFYMTLHKHGYRNDVTLRSIEYSSLATSKPNHRCISRITLRLAPDSDNREKTHGTKLGFKRTSNSRFSDFPARSGKVWRRIRERFDNSALGCLGKVETTTKTLQEEHDFWIPLSMADVSQTNNTLNSE